MEDGRHLIQRLRSTVGGDDLPGRYLVSLAEHQRLPDRLIRQGILRLLRERVRELDVGPDALEDRVRAFVSAMDAGPIAPVPEKANEQHYEVPEAFFRWVLGPNRKYSACYFQPGFSLEDAERRSLELSSIHAELANGQRVLELGCGWGAWSLWMAERYPKSSITAVSNSASQRAYILEQAKARGLQNLEVITLDMNDMNLDGPFDRVVSIEMFEHMRNVRRLFSRLAHCLVPGGKLFLHVFCHRNTPYVFDANGAKNWMGQYFFREGMMPSQDLYLRFQDGFLLEDKWCWDGRHYQKTADAWLQNLDRNRDPAEAVLGDLYGRESARLWVQRWRMFFMACSELFGFDRGREWFVGHYRFVRR